MPSPKKRRGRPSRIRHSQTGVFQHHLSQRFVVLKTPLSSKSQTGKNTGKERKKKKHVSLLFLRLSLFHFHSYQHLVRVSLSKKEFGALGLRARCPLVSPFAPRSAGHRHSSSRRPDTTVRACTPLAPVARHVAHVPRPNCPGRIEKKRTRTLDCCAARAAQPAPRSAPRRASPSPRRTPLPQSP